MKYSDDTIEAAVMARQLNLQAHAAHLLALGIAFVGDHALAEDSYTIMPGVYDGLIEYSLEAGKSIPFEVLSGKASTDRITEAMISNDSEANITGVMYLENELKELLLKISKDNPETDLAKFCDNVVIESGRRIYKYRRRLAKPAVK